MVGGSLSVVSSPDAGTVVTLLAPLEMRTPEWGEVFRRRAAHPADVRDGSPDGGDGVTSDNETRGTAV